MSGVWSSLIVEILGMVLAGLTIKLMDDWLDHEYDQCIGRITVSIRLGRACLPYTLVAFGLAMALAPQIALTLFLAAYAVGMGHDLRERMPTKLPGWFESMLALAVIALFAGPMLAAWGLFAMGMIQLLDDLMDLQKDRRSGQNNLAIRWGLVEATILMFICLLAAVLLSPLHTVEVLIATPMVHILLSLLGGIDWSGRRKEDA
jgi:1,4-dihydroxy-2-naphthoate octaprenyltransferase